MFSRSGSVVAYVEAKYTVYTAAHQSTKAVHLTTAHKQPTYLFQHLSERTLKTSCLSTPILIGHLDGVLGLTLYVTARGSHHKLSNH